MARQPRLDTPGALHHVIGRGIERATIFRTDADRNDFLDRLADLCVDGNLMVYAWSLLSNHFHLLVRTGRQPISKSMKKLLTGYVVKFNLRHKRCGHLFQNRYKSIICEEDPYLLELTRYIHLNPLRAGIVGDLEELRHYRWAGHSVIMGRVERGWQDIDTVLAYFGKGRDAVKKYEQFVQEGISQGRRPDLVGGGLIRSLGGWSQVLSLRRRGIKIASDERILGRVEFIRRILSEAEEREKETLRLSQKKPDLTTVARRVIEAEGIGESELRSGMRKREVVRVRRMFCQLAVREMGYAGAEVARFLGVTTSSVNRLAVSEETADLKKLHKMF
ncbi:MAG: transposase [Deltaproteobacteria bacterium]|nr:transposase [Deltaproteobacteria bacterium]MDP2972243.1 transposase [Deltaproteobacteria bacterium]